MAGALLFSPYSILNQQLNTASDIIAAHFNEIESAISKGISIKGAVRGKKNKVAIRRAIVSARLAGFQHGAKHSKKRMPANYGSQIAATAEKRASKVNTLMKRTTKKRLRSMPDSEYVLSKNRAMTAVRYEASRQYFRGVQDAFEGSGWKKEWVTSSEEACPECEANEEQGKIGVGEAFQSGHNWPSAHIGCSCGALLYP
jgi:hypothetical protein